MELQNDVKRKLTGKERAFLFQLEELLKEYECIMSVSGGCICFDMEDITETESIQIEGINAFYDIDDFINNNS